MERWHGLEPLASEPEVLLPKGFLELIRSSDSPPPLLSQSLLTRGERARLNPVVKDLNIASLCFLSLERFNK